MAAPVNANPTVTLGWTAVNWNPPITNYRIYQGSASRLYTNMYDVGTALLGMVNVARGTNYFAVTANITNTPNPLGSDFSAELIYVPTTQKKMARISSFVQTNSTPNTNLWTSAYTFPDVVLPVYADPQFYRTLIQINYFTTNSLLP